MQLTPNSGKTSVRTSDSFDTKVKTALLTNQPAGLLKKDLQVVAASCDKSSCLGFRLKTCNRYLMIFSLLWAAHPPSSNTLGGAPVHGNISILDAFQLVIILSLEDVNFLVDPCCRCVKISYCSRSSTNPSWVTVGCSPGGLVVAPVLYPCEKVGHVISLGGDDRVYFIEASESISILNRTTL